MTRSLRAALVVSLVVVAFACQKSDAPAPAAPKPPSPAAAAPPPAPLPLSVADIVTGKSLTPDKGIADVTTMFAPADTLYVSVKTIGAAPGANLAVRWTFEDGQVVNEDSQSIAPTGPATHEFHVAKADGWPTGKYKVAIALDGKPAGEREIEVR